MPSDRKWNSGAGSSLADEPVFYGPESAIDVVCGAAWLPRPEVVCGEIYKAAWDQGNQLLLRAESIGWVPLPGGAYAHEPSVLGDGNVTTVLVVGQPDEGYAELNVLLLTA